MQDYLHYIIEGIFLIVGFLLKKEHYRIVQEVKQNDKKIHQISNELRDFKHEVYKNYASKDEFSEKLNQICRSIEKIQEYLLKSK